MGVVLVVDPCVPVRVPVVRRLLSIELAHEVERRPELREGPPVAVTAECDGGSVVIAASSGGRARRTSREVELAERGSTNDRLLALAIAELVGAAWDAWADPAEPGEPAEPAEPTDARTIAGTEGWYGERPPPAPPVHRSRVRLLVGAGATLWGHPLRIAPAVGVRLEHDAMPPWGWGLGLRLGGLSVDTPLGQVDTRELSLDGVARLGGAAGWLRWSVGAGLRVGVVTLAAADPAPNPDTLRGLLVGPKLEGALFVDLGALVLRAGLEGGVSAVPLTGRVGGTEVAFAGPWAALGLAVGYGR